MSNAFTNFLGGVVDGVLGTSGAAMKDFQHADRLYVKDTYARSPKLGFLYFVDFGINLNAIKDVTGKWSQDYYKNVGMLVSRIEQPKFQIETETLNQYNRKTVVQKAIKYQPITIDLHDDNSEITRDLWKNYFQYYYADSIYGSAQRSSSLASFGDTKYGTTGFNYGLNHKQSIPFFSNINIYVLHQHKFTQYTLVNPIITEWNHDTLDQSEGGKTLSNKMTVAYETVLYNQGKIRKGTAVDKFRAYYDIEPSPLSIGGNGTKSLFGAGGLIDGADSIFGEDGSLYNNPLGAALQLNTLVKNAKQITKAGLQGEVTSILGSAVTGGGAGPAGAGLGNIGINIPRFGGGGTTTPTTPSSVTGR